MSANPSVPRARPHWLVWLFAGVGLLGFGAIIVIAWAILNLGGGSREPARIAGPTPETSFTVRDARPLVGTSFIQINIGAGSGRIGSGSYSSGMAELRNILLLDRRTGAVRRLLPDNERRIEQAYFLPAETDFTPLAAEMSQPGNEEPPPAFFVLLVAQPEADGRFDLLVGRLADERQAFVMRGIDGVDGMWMQSPTRIGLVVRERMNLHFRIVDVPSLRIAGSRRIAI